MTTSMRIFTLIMNEIVIQALKTEANSYRKDLELLINLN